QKGRREDRRALHPRCRRQCHPAVEHSGLADPAGAQMTALVVTGSIALFVLLGVLLLSLNFLSLWHWPIKAAATVITIGSSVVLYYAFVNVIGWPSQDRMPDRFSLLHTRIVEPDRMTGA